MTIINRTEWEIVHIPDKPTISPHQQPTVDVYAAVIDPKDANALVRKLNKIAPLEDFRHVKRIRRQGLKENIQLSVILCLACENDQDSIPNNVSELIKLYQLNIFTTKVCKFPPLSKDEWEEQCKLWPTSYHPPTYNIDGITGFTEEDSQFVLYFIKFAVHMAKFCERQVVNAAIIVDPSTKKVIARACDQICSQTPLRDTAILETCYCKQGETRPSQYSVGNANNHSSFNSNASLDVAGQLYSGVSCLSPWMWAKQKSPVLFCHPLRHAAMVAIGYSATRDLHLYPVTGATGGSPVKRQKISDNVKDEGKLETEANDFLSTSIRPYLCTGYDIFLAWEPCTMCAMALVHQRIRRIFYAFPNPNDGALGSVNRLQGEKSLNHHYAVFRVLLPQKVFEEINPSNEFCKICNH